jgi:prepilin-type N-terminal cleavage/methylation domain-containing protein
MISTYQRLKRRRDAGEIDGFTLIELLIVIVVLGILAAVVIFALGGITGKSAAASCQADGATVSTALAAFNAQNPTVLANVPGTGTAGTFYPTNPYASETAAQMEAILSGTSYGGPYIQSWPNNLPHYAYTLVWTDIALANGPLSATNYSVWSATLEVSTGNTGPVAGVYTPTVAAGNLIASGSPATSIPGGTNAPWIIYSGPLTCSGVA